MTAKYRSDIDGLRTVAVLPVVLFHADSPWFSGGFVGVDVFFVISGYLITGLVFSAAETGTFSFSEFYLRRIRRLLPATIPVVIFASWVAYSFFLPADFLSFSRSVVSVFTFSSNWLFLSQAGYFAEIAQADPLLHFWSLAVEEQFYLLMPALLAASLGIWTRKATIWLLTALLCVSFAVAVALVGQGHTNQAFYNSGARFWELLVGSLLAIAPIPQPGKMIALGSRIVGLALISGSMLLYSDDMTFPGVSALPPVIGTALILWPRENHPFDPVCRLLSLKPVVFVGMISYSLYLWHWPIIVWLKRTDLAGENMQGLAVGLSLMVSAVSYFAVERPFRFGGFLRPTMRAAGLLFSALAISIGMAGYAVATGGIPQRFPTLLVDALPYFKLDRAKKEWTRQTCAKRVPEPPLQNHRPTCIAAGDGKNVLLVGDSHVQHLLPGLKDAFPKATILSIMDGGCKPFEHYKQRRLCEVLADYLFHKFDEWDRLDAIVLSVRVADATAAQSVAETARWLKTKAPHVVVVAPFPEYRPTLPQIYLDNAYEGFDKIRSDANNAVRLKTSLEPIYEALQRDGITVIQPNKVLCHQGVCDIVDEKMRPIVLDYGHLTPEGSRYFISKVSGQILPNAER